MSMNKKYENNLCEVFLTRKVSNNYGTFGTFDFDGLKFSTLEPCKPIIPEGSYLLTFTYSPRFSEKIPYKEYKGLVPLINGVSGHEGIRIHVGNYLKDTQGCILVGSYNDDNMVFDSRKAYRDLMTRVQQRKYYNKNTFYVLHVVDDYE